MAKENTREIVKALREEIRRLERKPATQPCFASSGRPDIDALLPGKGFPRGALSELMGGPGSGKTAVALSSLAIGMSEEGLGAFVDGRGELYPPAVASFGLDLNRLLIVRPSSGDPGCDGLEQTRRALWAAEALLASGAFPIVVMDVPLELARVRGAPRIDAMLQRLRSAAERGGSAGLWLGSSDGLRIPAAVRIELSKVGADSAPRCALMRGAIRFTSLGSGHAA